MTPFCKSCGGMMEVLRQRKALVDYARCPRGCGEGKPMLVSDRRHVELRNVELQMPADKRAALS